jgi:hypothetical protein
LLPPPVEAGATTTPPALTNMSRLAIMITRVSSLLPAALHLPPVFDFIVKFGVLSIDKLDRLHPHNPPSTILIIVVLTISLG